jgi:hypothetical protein
MMTMNDEHNEAAAMNESLQALKRTRTQLASLITQMEKLLVDMERADEQEQDQNHQVRRPRFGLDQEQRISY